MLKLYSYLTNMFLFDPKTTDTLEGIENFDDETLTKIQEALLVLDTLDDDNDDEDIVDIGEETEPVEL